MVEVLHHMYHKFPCFQLLGMRLIISHCFYRKKKHYKKDPPIPCKTFESHQSLLSHQFPLSLPLEEPLDGCLRRARLTLQEGAAAFHPELHRFPQTSFHCTDTEATAAQKQRTAFTLHRVVKKQINEKQKIYCLTFGIEASALPQRVAVFDILPSAPPAARKGLKLTARNLLALAYKHHAVRVFYVPDLLVDGVKAEQLSPSQAQ